MLLDVRLRASLAVDRGALSTPPALVSLMAKALKPPADLTPEAQGRWRAVYSQLARRAAVDVDLLKGYCQAWARWRQAEDGISKAGQLIRTPKGHVVVSPLVKLAKDASQQARALEKQLGLDTPESATSTAERLITRRDLAARMNVHMQTITKWEQDGLPIATVGRKGKPSRYRESDVRNWLAAREDAAQRSGVVDVAQERARKERAQATLAEQTFRMREGDLLPRAEVERAWSAEVSAVRTKLLAWPATVADQLHRAATLDGVAGTERVLRAAVHDVLRELADPDRAPTPDTDGGGASAAA